MVRTRGQMAILRWFPNEIFSEIISHTTKADQASLCRVSKLFHKLSLPILNRVVAIFQLSAIESFCSALIAHPARAEAVRAFTAIVGDDWKFAQEQILISLNLMLNLEHFDVCGPCDFMSTTLQRSFHRLLSCYLRYPNGTTASPNEAASFLNRHQTLTCLVVGGLLSPSVRVNLPNLEVYEGNMAWLSKIVTGHLRKVRLVWSGLGPPANIDIENSIAALASLANHNVPFVSRHLCFLVHICITKIVAAVSTHMPQTMALQVYFSKTLTLLEYKNMLAAIAACLPRFTGLIFLAIQHIYDNRIAEKEMLRTCADTFLSACTTLEACALNQYAWRKVNRVWEECSEVDFRELSGLAPL
ncbi:hypothetical protein C8R43DRAFT_1134583 [Mycena crocata]|nr:hypothetical protein C8R43DRAFT_1134583 [Mycena crocata]